MTIGTLIGKLLVRVFWLSVASMHFVGSTLDSVTKLGDSVKSNTMVCIDYFKSQKLDNKSKPDGGKMDAKSSPASSTDNANKLNLSNFWKDKEARKAAKAACTAVNDAVYISSKVLLDVYLTGLGLVQNKDGTMWYWPWCVFHDKCHIKPKPKEDNLKALAEAIGKLQGMEIIKDGTFVEEKFKAKWPKELVIHQV